ncbi:hypothetical protein SAY86_020208 [Trapa natans]|uniref:Uncharacterized protein n=1 Tax=Trapa natans TaxID=22666 RepID=A0AAN7LPF5_TRANT|nr:hypothetical protein SAY86_020208 [Trapa natans]
MGGKGRKRREKNYRAAHGGNGSTLPPPPDTSKLDALPSKLRKLISFTSSLQSWPLCFPLPFSLLFFIDFFVLNMASRLLLTDSSKGSNAYFPENKRSGYGQKKTERSSLKDEPSQNVAREDGDHDKCTISSEPTKEIVEVVSDNKKKRKRKRAQVEDLRFQSSVEESSRRRERRKMRQKEYKEGKKNKHKRANREENTDFPRHEKVQFGDVVKAPPKLVAVPKGLKTPQDISKERVRLQTVEAYRKRKGWASRPGSHLPPSVDTLLHS